MITFYILLALSGVISIIQLFACFYKLESVRKITKPLVMLTLGFAVLLFDPNKYYILSIGLFLAMIGDTFIIFSKKRINLILGGVFFLACHIVYLYHFIQYFLLSNVEFNYGFLIAMIPVMLVNVIVFYLKNLMGHKIQSLGAGTYLFSLMLNISFITYLFFINYTSLLLVIWFGYLIFIASDIMVILQHNFECHRHINFFIMLTYIIAQFMISLGIIFLL